ncbi:condensation domain-containing protein [Streptomyces millisiae]|uniref:Condensation domain-containing protein n=1 Tax=Streptomyces millisiae TaxID=3075542 RepID=A0ABU2LN74_9ACTN|nr:condensation domain-containing protein [Streptomyces sp. DSM 44918]MDT0319037.1 condensation domain-containing protein [Streptomyces sp. DSM 44918]
MPTDSSFSTLSLPGDLPEPVVPRFFRAVREISCPEASALPLTAGLVAVFAGYTGHAEFVVGDRHFRVTPDTTVGELAQQAGRRADREITLGPWLTLRSGVDSLSAEYETDRYSPALIEGLLTDVRRVLGTSGPTTVAELGIRPLALAHVPAAAQAAPAAKVPPEGALEQAIAEVWSQVIELIAPEEIGRDDNFFALGGHSLAAIRAANRLSERYGVDLPKELISFAPTPREAAQAIAAAIEAGRPCQGFAPLAADAPVPHSEETPLPLAPAQEAIWLFEQWQPDTAAYHVPWAIELTGALEPDRLRRALEAVIERHAVLRTGIVAGDDGSPEAVVVPHAALPWAVHGLARGGAAGSETGLAAEALMARLISETFDLSRPPLLRADLLCLAPDHHVLLLTFHHLTLDGGSLEYLLRDLAMAYEGCELTPLPLQFQDVATWQRRAAGAERTAAARAYWRQELEGAPGPVALPGARERTSLPDHVGDSVGAVLDEAQTGAIRALARRLGVTPFAVLFTAFQVLLRRLTGQHDLVLGTAVTTRDHAECEGLIGPFFNTLPVRTHASEGTPFAEQARQSQERISAALAWKDIPFHTLWAGRGLDREPVYRMLFELSQPPRVPPPAGLEWNYRLLSPPAAKLDLIFSVTDHGSALEVQATYATDRYDRATAERVVSGYREVLAAACPDPLRDLLRRLWAEVLSVPAEQIHPSSDFFGLGGRSLDAVRLSSRLRRTLRVAVPAAQLFRAAGFDSLIDVIRHHATDLDALYRRASLALSAWDLPANERQALIERRDHV